MNITSGIVEDKTRPDKEQADRIEEAFLLQKSSGLNVATYYMAHHGVATDTVLRILLSTHFRRQLKCQNLERLIARRQQMHTESALDEALSEGFPASDPVAISIA